MSTSEERDREMREVLGKFMVPGANFPTWPNLKWSRARSHLSALSASFDEWQASAPIIIEGVLNDERDEIALVMRVRGGVPVHEWALSLGDALHNLRSAFDAVAWGMAHHNGAKPRRPKSVTFPVATDPEHWERVKANWLGDLDPDYQRRIEIMQPFTHIGPGEKALLSILSDLDNQDKHRNFVTVRAHLEQIDLSGTWVYEDVQASDVTPRIEMHAVDGIADGALVATIHAGARVARPMIMRLVPTCKMTLEHDGMQHEILPFTTALLNETRRLLDILIHGLAPMDEAEDRAPVELYSAWDGNRATDD